MIDDLTALLGRSRWFGGKGRPFRVVDVREVPFADDVVLLLVRVAFDDATGGEDLYQVPTLLLAEAREDLAHAAIGSWDDPVRGTVHAYDALHDHASAARWHHAFCSADPAAEAGAAHGGLRFHRVVDAPLDPEARSAVLSVEQSNSSVVFGEVGLMKVFRRVTTGLNPDIEIPAALTRVAEPHVPALLGWYELADGGPDGEPVQLGVLQEFLRTASDGWELALTSLRVLNAGLDDDDAQASGGDFAGEAERLGEALAHVHAAMASELGERACTAAEVDALADRMIARLDAARAAVPDLDPYAAALRAVFTRLREVGDGVRLQRVHGDLHLGQTLRTVTGWKLIDFEGEPAKPLPERREPDSVWRDVAGMIRSFDYAAESIRSEQAHTDGDADHRATARARDWANHNTEAFLTGYATAARQPFDQRLLDAYIADKAVYEAVYEARNRPTWLPIPLAALSRLAS